MSAQPARYTAPSSLQRRQRLPRFQQTEQTRTATDSDGQEQNVIRALMRWQTPIAMPAPARTTAAGDSGRTWAAATRKSEKLTQPACSASGITTVEKNTSPG